VNKPQLNLKKVAKNFVAKIPWFQWIEIIFLNSSNKKATKKKQKQNCEQYTNRISKGHPSR
jgi:hypothetical protein